MIDLRDFNTTSKKWSDKVNYFDTLPKPNRLIYSSFTGNNIKKSSKDGFDVELEMPGTKKENISISIEHKASTSVLVVNWENHKGSSTRQLDLKYKFSEEEVEAEYDNGLLLNVDIK